MEGGENINKMFKCNCIIGETYSCSCCNREFNNEEVDLCKEWKCHECGGRIMITIQREGLPELYLERKTIQDVDMGEHVFLTEDFDLHEVLGKRNTTQKKKEVVSLQLRGFGSKYYDLDSYVNCIFCFE